MDFKPYTKQFEVEAVSRITAKNIKNGFSKIVEYDIKNIVRDPSLSYALSLDKDFAMVTIELYGEPTGFYITEQDVGWQLYTGPFELFVNGTVRAKAVNIFNVESDIAFINVTGIIVSVPVFVNSPGLSSDKSEFTFSIDFPENVILKQYRINNEAWQEYTGPITVFKNMMVYARGQNSYGAWSREVSLQIVGIMLDAPVFVNSPGLSTDKSEHTVSINFASAAVIKQYRIDSGGWASYTGPITVFNNCTIYAISENMHGIQSAQSQFQVTGIVVDTPIISYVKDSPTASAAVTINFGNLQNKQYSFDNASWVTYVNPFTIYQDRTIYAKGISKGGVVSQATPVIITNLSTLDAPVINAALSSDKTRYTVTITYPDMAVTKQYRIDSGSWENYTATLTLYINGTVYARGANANNLWSNTAEYILNGIVIDTPVARSVTTFNQKTSAYIDINWGNLATTNRVYSLDQVTWVSAIKDLRLNSAVIADAYSHIYKNCTIYFKGKSQGGQDSSTGSVQITELVSPVRKGDTRRLTANEEKIQGMTFGNGTFVYLEYQETTGGTIYVHTSTDGYNLTRRSTGLTTTSSSIPSDMSFANNLFFMTGVAFLATSPDGITWTKRTLPTTAPYGIIKVVYGVNRYVAVCYYNGMNINAEENKLLTSTDAITWTAINNPKTDAVPYYFDICFYGTRFFLLSADWISSDRLFTSTNGTTWTKFTPVGMAPNPFGYNIVAANNILVTNTDYYSGGSSNDVVYTSATTATLAFTYIYIKTLVDDITRADEKWIFEYNDQFVGAVNLRLNPENNEIVLMKSTDGKNWLLDFFQTSNQSFRLYPKIYRRRFVCGNGYAIVLTDTPSPIGAMQEGRLSRIMI